MTAKGPGSKSGTGLDSNVAAAIAYALGPVGGLLMLLLEKHDSFVRFHALQSIVTFIGIAVVHLMLRNLPLLFWMASAPLILATIALWIFLMFKAIKRERYKLPVVGDFVERQLTPRAR